MAPKAYPALNKTGRTCETHDERCHDRQRPESLRVNLPSFTLATVLHEVGRWMLRSRTRCHERFPLLQHWLDRVQSGDAAAREHLMRSATPQLKRIMKRMFRQYQRLRRWETMEDVAQVASFKLWLALDEVTPTTVPDFSALASEQVCRVLLDMTRHCFEPEGLARHTESMVQIDNAQHEPCANYADAADLARWTSLHEAIAALPEEERDVAKIMWYGQATLCDAAKLLGLSRNTVQRRWQKARQLLRAALAEAPPVRKNLR